MKTREKRRLTAGLLLMASFILWTILVQTVDVQAIGQNGTTVGFASLNRRFHQMTGVHMTLYHITDWLGLIPAIVCLCFGGLGLHQWICRKSLRKVDADLFLLGAYYVIVIAGYLVFEMVPVNYRPILIEGRMEASYPSSTTLLVLSVMPTLSFQASRRLRLTWAKQAISVSARAFSLFMVIGRTVSGVHWITDIAGAVLFSAGLFCIYQAVTLQLSNKK